MSWRETGVELVIAMADWAMLKLTRGRVGITEEVRLAYASPLLSNQALADYMERLPVDPLYHHDASDAPVLTLPADDRAPAPWAMNS